MSFWDIVWFIFISFLFISYLMVLFNIVADLFRDAELSGGMKAVWMIALIFLPLLTAVVYLIARGKGMTQRSLQSAERARERQDDYIRSVARTSPTEEISRAKGLLDSGAISQQEFESIKAGALSKQV